MPRRRCGTWRRSRRSPQSLAVLLADRHDEGEPPPAVATWRIEENRWRACRYGVEGELLDLRSGEPQPARARLHALIDELEPVAERLGCAAELELARGLAERNGAMRLRDAAGSNTDLRRATKWLCEIFLE